VRGRITAAAQPCDCKEDDDASSRDVPPAWAAPGSDRLRAVTPRGRGL